MYIFMTIEEFLGSFEGNRLHLIKDAGGWLEYYETARASFEKYGPEGPPYGTEVKTLRPGFGGKAGVIRTLVEYTSGPERYIGLKRDDGLSISERAHWWCDFKVADVTV